MIDSDYASYGISPHADLGDILTSIDIFKKAVEIIDNIYVGHHHKDNTTTIHSIDGNYSYKIINMGFNGYGGSIYGSYARQNYRASHRDQELTAFATVNNIFYDPIDVEIRNLNTNALVLQPTTVTDGSIITYTVPGSGINQNYELKYSNSFTKKSWNLGFRFRHYLADLTGIYPQVINNYDEDDFIIEEINNRILIKPSQSIQTFDYRNDNNTNIQLSFKELRDQFYWDDLEIKMNYAKNYKAGDEIIINDEIIDIVYNKLKDSTSFGFKSANLGNEIEYITFNGDLSSKYSIGDRITLRFTLLSIDGSEFVEIDYNKLYYEKCLPPQIEEFIIFAEL